MEQIGVFDNSNVPTPPLKKRAVLPACVCNYNAANVIDGVLYESHINSTEQRSFTLTNRMSVQIDSNNRKYIYGNMSTNTNPSLTYATTIENPFNIGLGSLATDYGVNFTFICRGRCVIANRSYYGSWKGYNNYF